MGEKWIFHTNRQTNKQTDKQTNRQTDKQQTNRQTEKIKDLSPVQLTVSNSSQTSVDSVSHFVSDLSQVLEPSLSQAVSMLDSAVECAVVWVQCCILALPLDIDSVNQCHKPVHTCSDLSYLQISDKHSL